MSDYTTCHVCRGSDGMNQTVAADKLPDGTMVWRHPLCQPGPSCPVHRCLLTGGGEFWVCDVVGCDERVMDHGDHPDRPEVSP